MSNRHTTNDENSDTSDSSELYRSLVLEIESALARGENFEIPPALLAALTPEELARFFEVRRSLELLHNSFDKSWRRKIDTATTMSMDVIPSFHPNINDAGCVDEPVPSPAVERANHGPRFGRFEIVRQIGRGGQGVVYLVRDPTLNRQVALKVPCAEILITPAMKRRFITEGRAAAILTHPNVVPVLEAGQIGPVCYLAQVYIAGPTLADWQKKELHPIPPRTAARIVAQLADGVEYAHARGVLHRDLKPSNVLLDSEHSTNGDGEKSVSLSADRELPFVPRITDFGVARMLESEGNETLTGTILGTAAYMSPEQAKGHSRQMSAASDIYSLGAILYELLTTVPVFQGETYLETLQLVTTTEPTPPRKLRRGLSRDLEAICLKCLEKEPKQRYASAFYLAADLRRYLANEPTHVRPIKPPERIVRWCRRKPGVAGLIGIAITAVVALVANILWTQSRLEQLIVEANEGRQQAEANERLANENKELAMRRQLAAETMAYAADMRLVSESWESSSAPAINSLLQAHVPTEGRPDLRGFEWWLYDNLLNRDTPSIQLGSHQGKVLSVAVSPKGDLAASGGSDGIVRLWALPSGAPAGELRGHDRKDVSGLAFSPDGSRLASASDDKTVRVWDVSQEKQLWCLTGHGGWVSAVAFLFDGDTLASGAADKTIILWDLKSGKETGRLTGHTDTVRALAFLRRRRLLFSAAEDGTVRYWDFKKGPDYRQVPNESLENPGRSWIRCLAIEPDETTLLGIPFSGQPPVMWDVRPGNFRVLRQIKVAGGPRGASVQGSKTNPVVAFGLEDSFVRIRSYGSQDGDRVLRGHLQTVDSVALTPNARALISGSHDGSVRLWNLSSDGRFAQTLALAQRSFWLSLSPNGKLIALTTADGETKILDFTTLKTLRKLRQPGSIPVVHAFSPDSTTLVAIATEEPLRFYSSAERPREIPVSGTLRVAGISFSPDGRIVAIIDDMTLIIVNVASGAVLDRVLHKTRIRDVAFIDETSLLSSCLDGELCRWSLGESPIRKHVPLNVGDLHDIAVSADRRLAAIRGFHQVKIVDPATLQVLASLPDQGEAGGICFLADGRTLLLGDGSARPRLWKTDGWQRMGTLETDSMFFARVSTDGYRLVGARLDRLITFDARPNHDSPNLAERQ